MGKIRQLDTQTANMIAAGEVVERPMGIVKELVENAIDAGSTRITVITEEGGIQKITVEDDGCGMDSSDAQMAFARHATSKIFSHSDLWNISTLGFRGEALPSIASVSKVVLCTSDGTDATRIEIEYGKVVSASPYPCSQGTQITVSGLFYRTPARLKHMRSANYENSLIQTVIGKFALSHPEIAFHFISDGRDAFRTTGSGDLLEVIFQLYGRSTAENALPFACADMDYEVEGYLVRPMITRASRNAMHVFLNGRMVRTFKLYKAVQDGYEDFIVKGRFPIVVLNVKMDPHLLDVNVHPGKWEVRLSKEIQLENLIRDHVRKTLSGNVLAPKAEISKSRNRYYEPISFDTDALIRETIQKEERPEPAPKPEPVQYTTEEFRESLRKEAEQDAEILRSLTAEKKPEYKAETRSFPAMEVIGQLHEKFILCACEAGLAVIDQHAAQERVHYEEYQKILNQEPAMVPCLIPHTLHVTDDIVQRLDELNEAVKDIHVRFEAFGHDTLIVHEVPVWMTQLEEDAFLEDVLDQFRNERETKYTRMEKKKIATMACHHSIRFNKSLTMEEMKEAVRQLSLCENPYHCPHGRPTFIIMDEKELTKEFLR